MSTNIAMQKRPNGISEEMSAGTGTYKPGSSQQDHSPAMTYTDAEGAMRTEPLHGKPLSLGPEQ